MLKTVTKACVILERVEKHQAKMDDTLDQTKQQFAESLGQTRQIFRENLEKTSEGLVKTISEVSMKTNGIAYENTERMDKIVQEHMRLAGLSYDGKYVSLAFVKKNWKMWVTIALVVLYALLVGGDKAAEMIHKILGLLAGGVL